MAKKFDEDEGVWRTVGGRRIFIRTGQSLSDAMIKSGKFKDIKKPAKKAKEQPKDEKKRLDYYELDEKGERKLRTRYSADDERGHWEMENGQRVFKENPNWSGEEEREIFRGDDYWDLNDMYLNGEADADDVKDQLENMYDNDADRNKAYKEITGEDRQSSAVKKDDDNVPEEIKNRGLTDKYLEKKKQMDEWLKETNSGKLSKAEEEALEYQREKHGEEAYQKALVETKKGDDTFKKATNDETSEQEKPSINERDAKDLLKALNDEGSDFTFDDDPTIEDGKIKTTVGVFMPDERGYVERDLEIPIDENETYDSLEEKMRDWQDRHRSPDTFEDEDFGTKESNGNSPDDIVNDDAKGIDYSFRTNKRDMFNVRYNRVGNNKNMDFATSASRFNRNRTDYDMGGQAQKEILGEGTKAREFFDKWDNKHLNSLTQKEYNELANDIEELKKEYSYIEGSRFEDQVKLDREYKPSSKKVNESKPTNDASYELTSDDPNRFGDKMRKVNDFNKAEEEASAKRVQERFEKEQASKSDNDWLPKKTEIKEQGKSNRKEVSENIQAHILEHYDSPEDFIEQMDAMDYLPTKWKAGEELAKGGSYLIYNGDMADFLNELKINPKGKTFSEDKAFDMYTSLIGRESAKLYDRIKNHSGSKNPYMKAYKEYMREHPNSKVTFAEFRKNAE